MRAEIVARWRSVEACACRRKSERPVTVFRKLYGAHAGVTKERRGPNRNGAGRDARVVCVEGNGPGCPSFRTLRSRCRRAMGASVFPGGEIRNKTGLPDDGRGAAGFRPCLESFWPALFFGKFSLSGAAERRERKTYPVRGAGGSSAIVSGPRSGWGGR